LVRAAEADSGAAASTVGVVVAEVGAVAEAVVEATAEAMAGDRQFLE
jgi:hypothetical protein